MFATLPGLSREEVKTNRVRKFKGDGSQFLRVEGLKEVESIRIGTTVLPRTVEQRFPQSGRVGSYVDTELPLYIVQRDESGIAYLLRNECSNDGKWQEGAEIWVTGDWDSAEEGTPSEAPAPMGEAAPGGAEASASSAKPK